jgi:hypothetical protein
MMDGITQEMDAVEELDHLKVGQGGVKRRLGDDARRRRV